MVANDNIFDTSLSLTLLQLSNCYNVCSIDESRKFLPTELKQFGFYPSCKDPSYLVPVYWIKRP